MFLASTALIQILILTSGNFSPVSVMTVKKNFLNFFGWHADHMNRNL